MVFYRSDECLWDGYFVSGALYSAWTVLSHVFLWDWGTLEGVTHDYVRNGTTTLFAALDIANGQVHTACKNRHRHQEYLQFLKQVDASVPPDMAIHLVVDNYATHKHPGVKRWLAAHPRYQVHYTPTYASWLNQVEIWFNIIAQRAIRRGTFKSVKDLIPRKWGKSLNRETIAAEMMKDVKEQLPKIEAAAQMQVGQNLLPVILKARESGENMEIVAFMWYLEWMETWLGSDKFKRYIDKY